jgi:Asp-tRNA(Asn)/Glu-tRNA(Gln) amidotransferase A subunit family amidase
LRKQAIEEFELNDLTHFSAAQLADLIRSKKASPVEVVEAHLKRIESLNPTLNAIVTIPSDLLTHGRQAEHAMMRGDQVGPLHGVPLTIKDTIETGGLLSTSGSPARATFVPAQDAPSVARLKAAGAIILGKTNPAEMAMDYTAENPLFPPTNNPYDLSRTPGGSSGGEAAAITTCMSPAGLGSDLAGSIRIPAHFCGIAGLKPTTGSVPGAGQFPPAIGPYSLGAVIGPMARRVEDLRLMFRALTNREITPNAGNLKGVRVGWYTNDGVAPVTEETAKAVAQAAQALADAGLITEQRKPPGIDRGYEMWLKLFSRASVVQLRDVYDGREEQAGGFVRWRLATADDGPIATLDEYIKDWMERDRLRLDLTRWMNNVPLLLAPVGATPALKHGSIKVTVGEQTMSAFKAFSYCHAFNVFDLPSVCVPAGHSSDGLPIGVQVVGRPHEEEIVLSAAGIIEEALGGWRPPILSTDYADYTDKETKQ